MLLKKSPGNDRKYVDDVILLFTDGKPNARKRLQEISDADYYSKVLKSEKNIKIIVVAAGDVYAYRSNIQGWASSPDLVFETELTKLGIEENINNLVEQLKHPLCGCGKCSRQQHLFSPASTCPNGKVLKWYQNTTMVRTLESPLLNLQSYIPTTYILFLPLL